MRTHFIPRTGRCLLLIPALLLLVSPAAQAAAPVRWKLKEGDKLEYVLERNLEGMINLSGAEISFTLSMTLDTAWTVNGVGKDGLADVDQKIDRIKISMSSPLGGDLAYDSAKPDDKPDSPIWGQLEPMIDGLQGGVVKAKISPLGQVTDIKLPEKLAEVFSKQQQGGNRQQGFGIGMNSFTEAGVKELIEKSVLLLPEAAPAKDVAWKQTFKNVMPGIGTQTAETSLAFDVVEKQDGKDLQKITSKTELTFEPDENPRAELEIIEQEGTATYYFDAAAGRMFKATGTQKSSMELTGPQEVTQEIKETVNMRQGKSEPAEEKKEEPKEDTKEKKEDVKEKKDTK